MYQLEFEERCFLDEVDGRFLICGGEPGQLNQDTVAALGLDERLGDAQAVHAFAQDFDCLRKGSLGLRGFRQGIGVHLDEEGSSALKVQAEANASGSVALQAVENVSVWMSFVLGIVEGKITGEVIRPAGFLEI